MRNKNIFLCFFIFSLLFLSCVDDYKFIRDVKTSHFSVSNPIRSVVFTGYGRGVYKTSLMHKYVGDLLKLKSNMASLLITCMTENVKSSDVSCQGYETPSKREIKKAGETIKRAGLMLSLRIYIDLKSKDWRCHWNPDDKAKAFKNIKDVLLNYAELAEEIKTETLIIGAEYCQLTKPQYGSYWKDIIHSVRKVFHGSLTYGANTNAIRKDLDEYQYVTFWNDLDFIGIDHYPEFPKNKTFETSSFSDFQKKYKSSYIQFSHALKKPFLITEVGIPVESQGIYKPWDYNLKGPDDRTLQSKAYQVFLSEFYNSDFAFSGSFLWRIQPEDYKKDQPKNYFLLHEKTLKSIEEGWEK